MKTETVAIIGDGQMGLVLADALAAGTAAVRLWGPTPSKVTRLGETRRSDRLPGFELPASVDVHTAIGAVLENADFVVNAIPTQFIRRVWTELAPSFAGRAPIICVSKGIERGTLLRPTQIIEDVLDRADVPVAALSGPTIAAELARHLPATMVAAADEPRVAEATQRLFTAPWLRVYRHDDLLGVELAGATKNVIALAAGMVDGLGAGDNAKSALLARGLAEIARLGAALGARRETFFGIAGLGDLAVTCISPSGRNRTCGERLGRGERLDAVLESTTSVVEGVPTTEAVAALARSHGVEMPITEAVAAILWAELAPAEAIERLMSREAKAERIG